MIDTRTVGQELQDLQHQIVGRIRKGQETVAGAIKTWARNAQTITPQIPALPSPGALTSRLPKPEAVAARLPRPEALVSGAYDIAEQIIAAQRKLGEQVTQAAKPLMRQGAAMFAQSSAQSARSAKTSRTTAPAKPTATAKSSTAKSTTAKSSTAGSGRKTAHAKPATATKSGTASANGTAAKKARSARK